MVQLVRPENGAVVSQKKEIMRTFEKDVEGNAQVFAWCTCESEEFGVCTIPEPVRFEWETGDGEGNFELSDREDFSHIVYSSENTGSFEAYNLFIGTQYWWRVGGSETRTFFTEDSTPRWMFVEGTFNVRDIGGYTNIDGKRIRQGVLYRGCELDGDEGRAVTEKGKKMLMDFMGIRFDMDLRGSGRNAPPTVGPLGPDVGYINIDSESYGEFIGWKSNYMLMLNVLSDPKNYPVYCHCAVGADRTGSFIALLEGLLRMDYEDICREYEMSTLCFPDGNRTRHEWTWDAYTGELERFGDSFQEKCYNHAIWCGATPEQIETIRRMFIEDYE